MMNENYMNERTGISYQSHAGDSFPDLKASGRKAFLPASMAECAECT